MNDSITRKTAAIAAAVPILAVAWCSDVAALDANAQDPVGVIEVTTVPRTEQEQESPDDAEREPRILSTFGSSEIQGWHVPDNRTLIIRTYTHGNFKATLLGPCTGVRFAETLGFSTQGPYELDRSTNVVLPDGRRCAIRKLVRYTEEDELRDRETQQ